MCNPWIRGQRASGREGVAKIKIFHTADVHLGLKFVRDGYPAALRERLVHARHETLATMVQQANHHRCDLLVIAGDLFDTIRVGKTQVRQTARALSNFDGTVLVLPGNHDFYHDTLEVWSVFKEAMGENTVLLSEARAYDLAPFGVDAVICAAPCTDKHSQEHALSWLVEDQIATNERLHIGVAHGSLLGVSNDRLGNYYPMTETQLRRMGMHLWLLGHSHLRHPDMTQGNSATIFYPSTPEPDGFDCRHEGFAWLIEVEGDRQITYQSLPLGTHAFQDLKVELHHEADIETLKRAFRSYLPDKHLVKLTLTGRLPSHLYDELPVLLEGLGRQVLYLETHAEELHRELTMDDIDREFTADSFPHRLLRRLMDEQKNPLALQLAYEMLQEARA